ncbi:hypothetical protein GOBAR_AA17262 [Gossypium barbadense]|uniref:Uncharacterized protein n=1 Tax=Gossypium barbadense TaxID=3634 RepID=A0A2P5XJD4_GOSBA|nr:hypothetical protein GOBAR_AA17262 [Gossypium barbadense]
MNWTMDGWWLRWWVLMTWRNIISNVLWVLLLGGLDEAVLRKEPKVLCQSSHIGPDRDDPSPMSLRLMADGEGDKVGKVEDVPGWGEGRCLRAARIIGGRGRDEKVEHSSIVSSRYVGSMISKKSPHDSAFRRARTASSWGPKGNSRKMCLISTVGPEDDAAPFLFFDVETAVFLPHEDDIVYLH